MQANPPGQVGPCLTVDTHGCDILLLLYDIVIKLMLFHCNFCYHFGFLIAFNDATEPCLYKHTFNHTYQPICMHLTLYLIYMWLLSTLLT